MNVKIESCRGMMPKVYLNEKLVSGIQMLRLEMGNDKFVSITMQFIPALTEIDLKDGELS